MNLNDIKSRLNNFNKIINLDKEGYLFEDFINFLEKSSNGFIPMIIIRDKDIWLFSLIVPKNKLTEEYIDNLLNWDIYSARYGYCKDNTGNYCLTKPCDSCEPNDILEDAIPVFFQRELFAGAKFDVELNQQIAHVLELGKLDETDSYYKLEKGDYAKVTESYNKELSVHTFNKKDLDKLLSISNSVLIRFFTSSISGDDVELNLKEETIKNDDTNIHYTYFQNSNSNHATKYVKGFQVIYPEKEWNDDEEEREFETFLIKDLETGDSIEHTCNPDKVGNRFIKSEYPLDLSQAYFDKDVLDKYEKDSEKYTIEDRHIRCRGYWDLRCFMSDDKHQVIVYLCDLSSLPFEEQKHWKRFNVKPNSNIPDHIIKNDFMGEWHDLINPLEILKTTLRQFPKFKIDNNEVDLWVEKNKNSIRNLDKLRYLREGTKDEWEREINKLYLLLVEGLNKNAINKIAKYYGCSKRGSQSIDNLQAILNKLNIDKAINDAVVIPLYELMRYRNDVNHSREMMKYPSDLNEKLIEIYNDLIRRLLYSFEYLSRIVKSGQLDLVHN